MKKKVDIEGLECLYDVCENSEKIAYILYPMDVLDQWIEPAVKKYGCSIVVITGMDWDNVFSPWPAPGEPPGSPDFQGKSKQFLELLENKVVPAIEKLIKPGITQQRTLVGVSMSGLFALWQWMVSDVFENIACLSGSFWFPGFMEWMQKLSLPHKTGEAYFLLGVQEPNSPVKAFRPVGVNTQAIISLLKSHGTKVEFQSVAGNHFSDPLPRLDKAFTAIFR